MPNFIEEFLAYTKDYESPRSFWRWAAYTAVAAVLRDKVFFQYKDFKVGLNIYVLELAGSATHRKGMPLQVVKKLVAEINNTKIISGRSSIQAVMNDLSQSYTQGGKLIKGGSALFSAEEMASAIVEDPAAIKILTDIYDSRLGGKYEVNLKGSGKATIDSLCFTMHAASNEQLLKSVYGTDAVYGGLLSRTFLVKPDEMRPSNSMMDEKGHDPVKAAAEMNRLVSLLRTISGLEGRIEWSVAAHKAYDEWYDPFRRKQAIQVDKSGILGRLHIGVLKLAMIIEIAEKGSMLVSRESFEKALDECIRILPNYNDYIMGSGKSEIAEAGTIVIEDLLKAPKYTLSQRELLSEHWADFDIEMLDKVTKTLEAAGFIESRSALGTGVSYTLTKKAVDKFDDGIKIKEDKNEG